MDVMLQAARFLLQKKPQRKILLDGRTFSRRYQIDRVVRIRCRDFAAVDDPGMFLFSEEESARRRLEHDLSHPACNRTFALYLDVKARFEPITYQKTVIDTDQSPQHCVQQAITALS